MANRGSGRTPSADRRSADVSNGAVIAEVAPQGLAARAKLLPDDVLLTINGKPPRDYIDYRYLIACERLTLRLRRGNSVLRARLDKPADADLGLRFTSDVFDRVITCNNRCVFCFVDQLPMGLRSGLYLHDDDYRLSFLHGSFITLTNLTEADFRRIARLHLSPLYVSVHTTNPALRARMFRHKRLPDVLHQLHRLIRAEIELHTQIVLCPSSNDGEELSRTVSDLSALHPGVRSIGIVPVGLTTHRVNVPVLRPVGWRTARAVLQQIRDWQRAFLRQLGTRLVFASDELYLLAGEPLPSARSYEGYPQLENGIGLARRFLDQLQRLRVPPLPKRSVTLVTGRSAQPLVEALAEKLQAGGLARVRVVAVPNRLFGPRVTVAGLLAGYDVLLALRSQPLGDLALVPGAAVRDGLFLDDLSLDELSDKLGVRVIAASTPRQALDRIRSLT